MKKIFIILQFLICLNLIVAGGQNELSPDDNNRLEEAFINPVEDISGYSIRISGWWDGPDDKSLVGRQTLKRWKAAEEEFDVSLNWVKLPSPRKTVEELISSVLSGEPVADVINLNSIDAIPSLVEANLILPLDDYFDFNDPKWPVQIRKFATYKGKTYGFFTNFMTAHGIWYNKSLFKREGLPDLYELQQKGEWTWEKYLEIAKKATKDTNGDGEPDQFGITIGYEIEYPIIYSNSGKVVEEVDGNFRFSLNSKESLEALSFIQEIYNSDIFSLEGEELFIEGNAAMYGGEIFQGWNMSNNMSDDYGFVFYPKGPDAEDYSSLSSGIGLSVFPANLNYPPQRLAEIIEKISLFDLSQQITMEYLNDRLTSAEDIETTLSMMEKTEFNRTEAFSGLNLIIGKIFEKIQKGVSPASAVGVYYESAQQIIDSANK